MYFDMEKFCSSTRIHYIEVFLETAKDTVYFVKCSHIVVARQNAALFTCCERREISSQNRRERLVMKRFL